MFSRLYFGENVQEVVLIKFFFFFVIFNEYSYQRDSLIGLQNLENRRDETRSMWEHPHNLLSIIRYLRSSEFRKIEDNLPMSTPSAIVVRFMTFWYVLLVSDGWSMISSALNNKSQRPGRSRTKCSARHPFSYWEHQSAKSTFFFLKNTKIDLDMLIIMNHFEINHSIPYLPPNMFVFNQWIFMDFPYLPPKIRCLNTRNLPPSQTKKQKTKNSKKNFPFHWWVHFKKNLKMENHPQTVQASGTLLKLLERAPGRMALCQARRFFFSFRFPSASRCCSYCRC